MHHVFEAEDKCINTVIIYHNPCIRKQNEAMEQGAL